jgi:maleate cis-trans isomerase
VNLPASTTSTAAIEAFRTLGIQRIAVATPYEAWVDDLKKKFFEGNDVKVINIQGLAIKRGTDVWKFHPETLYRFARAQDREEADALFLSCMGLRTLEVLVKLEDDLGKPVLSSNQVTLWKLFNMCGIPRSDIRCNFGSLFSRERESK